MRGVRDAAVPPPAQSSPNPRAGRLVRPAARTRPGWCAAQPDATPTDTAAPPSRVLRAGRAVIRPAAIPDAAPQPTTIPSVQRTALPASRSQTLRIRPPEPQAAARRVRREPAPRRVCACHGFGAWHGPVAAPSWRPESRTPGRSRPRRYRARSAASRVRGSSRRLPDARTPASARGGGPESHPDHR